jgi:NADPH:quinone reductase-like Zn-dependent oxidoreductase
MGTQAGQRSE